MPVFKGINFPFTAKPSGLPASVTPDELFKQSIEQILLTRLGERVMLPEFGSDIYKLLFENISEDLDSRLIAEVRRAIERWEDRIEIVDVKIEHMDTAIGIKIVFRVLNRDISHEIIIKNGK